MAGVLNIGMRDYLDMQLVTLGPREFLSRLSGMFGFKGLRFRLCIM